MQFSVAISPSYGNETWNFLSSRIANISLFCGISFFQCLASLVNLLTVKLFVRFVNADIQRLVFSRLQNQAIYRAGWCGCNTLTVDEIWGTINQSISRLTAQRKHCPIEIWWIKMNPGERQGVNERGRGEIDSWDRARTVFVTKTNEIEHRILMRSERNWHAGRFVSCNGTRFHFYM